VIPKRGPERLATSLLEVGAEPVFPVKFWAEPIEKNRTAKTPKNNLIISILK
jgi:hypothetical protein